MKITSLLVPLSLLLLAGCVGQPPTPKALTTASPTTATAEKKAEEKAEEKAEIEANLGKLAPEDRKLAEAQGYCAVDTENRLGSMGAPFKVMVKDQPVFLCCKGCKNSALKDPDRTLARVKDLQARVKAAK